MNNKYKITISYDRVGCEEIIFELEYPQTPNPKQWEDETIENEVYWKVETSQGIVFARKSFINGIQIEKV